MACVLGTYLPLLKESRGDSGREQSETTESLSENVRDSFLRSKPAEEREWAPGDRPSLDEVGVGDLETGRGGGRRCGGVKQRSVSSNFSRTD
jgi:hypothetical protein